MRTMRTDFDKRFNRTRKFILVFYGCVLAMVLTVFVGFAALAYAAVTTAVSMDWSGGVKPVIEKVWCGATGCFGA